jgi:stalled ribosome rescue protein Dom34
VTTHSHTVVWIDHREAHVIHFNLDDAEESNVKPETPHRHLHPTSGSPGAGHDKPDAKYLHAVAAALADAGEILIVGPANAKTELMSHLKQHDAATAKKVTGVETVDHPSEGELLKYARKYFLAIDNMQGITPAPRR